MMALEMALDGLVGDGLGWFRWKLNQTFTQKHRPFRSIGPWSLVLGVRDLLIPLVASVTVTLQTGRMGLRSRSWST